MAALREIFDTNQNGQLDAGDVRFSEFRVWRDTDQDGLTDSGEVKTLGEWGIASIGLHPTAEPVDFREGTRVAGYSSFTRADGSTGTAADVRLGFDPNGYRVFQRSDGFEINRENGAAERYFVAHEGSGPVTLNLGPIAYSGAIGSDASDIFIAAIDRPSFIAGNLGDDIIVGGAENDVLVGGSGADQLYGGVGSDTLIAEISDAVIDGGAGFDTVRFVGAGATFGLAAHAVEAAFGTEAADFLDASGVVVATLVGGGGDDVLIGGSDSDILNGGDGNDVIHGGAGGDFVIGGAGSNELFGEGGNDVVADGAHGSLIDGGDGDDVLIGAAGNDVMVGGAGRDVVDLSGNRSDYSIVYNAGTATSTVSDLRVGDSDGIDTVSGVEVFEFSDGFETYDTAGHLILQTLNAADGSKRVIAYGTVGVALAGTAFNDVLTGAAGSDALTGGAGADVMAGGAGDDYYQVDNPGDQVIERPGEGRDTVHAWVGFTLGDNVEVLALGAGAGAIYGIGNALDNWIEGNESANYLYGGGGGDTMEGGGGDDYYQVDNPADRVTERPGEGRDLVHAWVGFTLGDNIENLALGAGAGAIHGIGNALDNWIGGNESANYLFGGGGADAMEGGAGDDYYQVDNSADRVTERAGEGRDLVHAWVGFTLGAEIEVLALGAGAGAIYGIGNALDNWIGGNESANYIYGAGGADTMEGGAGDDYYQVDNPGDRVTERAGEGRDLVHAWVGFTLGDDVENLALGAGAGAIYGIGNALDNWIGGNESANYIYGAGGADTMEGGAGDDYYQVDNPGDRVTERPGEGRDLVHSWVGFTLGDDIENLALGAGAGAIHGIGNALDNWIGGNESANYLFGAGGADTMEGAAGDDYYQVDNPGDRVIERPGEGRDLVHAWVGFTLGDDIENLALGAGAGAIHGIGNALDNWIGGNESANTIYGAGGTDTMVGGAGDDWLAGGEGTDTAVFSGARLDYAVTFDAAAQTYTVADHRAGAPDGSDSVTGVELFLFADRTVHQWELLG